jgi:polyhydroxyalkanoate synthesis repressor PhaR
MSPPVLIKKYGNRRLYDTGESRYITLDELAAKIRTGVDVRIVDASSGEDLTQVTLTQLILESGSGARVLPVALLTQLVRLGDDGLAEFFSRYVTAALDLYLQGRRNLSAFVQYNPLAQIPLAATDALSRMWGSGGPPSSPPPPAPERDDVASLRREIEELKRSMRPEAPTVGKPGAKRRPR